MTLKIFIFLLIRSEAGSKIWTQANKKPIKLTTTPISNLNKSHAYFFRVRAFNRWGRSPASLPIGPIALRERGIPRHPFGEICERVTCYYFLIKMCFNHKKKVLCRPIILFYILAIQLGLKMILRLLVKTYLFTTCSCEDVKFAFLYYKTNFSSMSK